jgi:hypothetical protein
MVFVVQNKNYSFRLYGIETFPMVKLLKIVKRDSVTRFFASGFFHESVSPNPLSIPLGPFRSFFENSRRYSQLKVDHRCG